MGKQRFENRRGQFHELPIQWIGIAERQAIIAILPLWTALPIFAARPLGLRRPQRALPVAVFAQLLDVSQRASRKEMQQAPRPSPVQLQ